MRSRVLDTGEPGFHPVRKLRTVASGLRVAALTDFSVAYKLALSALVLVAAFWLRAWVDVLLVLLATATMLAAEMMNTAIEALCDFVEARHDERIRAVKDIAAAAVGIAIFAWAAIVAVEGVRLWRQLAA